MKNISVKKRNKVLVFLLAFMPGAAEMYMGFIKMGASLMALFIACFSCMTIGMDFLGAVALLIWFIGFFHALNLSDTEDSKFLQITDDWIWNEFFDGAGVKISPEKRRKSIAIILIIVGLAVLWNTLVSIIEIFIPDYLWEAYYSTVKNVLYNVPQLFISCLIILIGFKLIKGKKQELMIEEKE
ncbi:MAG: hypothetical protein K6B41_07570 [Butyrivibrio sp.]|nr:hypothetical protein [Butyrivibrio sp.]